MWSPQERTVSVVRRSIDDAADDHPADEDKEQASWMVGLADDCEGCGDLRVNVTLEDHGRPGTGVIAHLAPASARRLRRALADALRELGEDAGP